MTRLSGAEYEKAIAALRQHERSTNSVRLGEDLRQGGFSGERTAEPQGLAAVEQLVLALFEKHDLKYQVEAKIRNAFTDVRMQIRSDVLRINEELKQQQQRCLELNRQCATLNEQHEATIAGLKSKHNDRIAHERKIARREMRRQIEEEKAQFAKQFQPELNRERLRAKAEVSQHRNREMRKLQAMVQRMKRQAEQTAQLHAARVQEIERLSAQRFSAANDLKESQLAAARDEVEKTQALNAALNSDVSDLREDVASLKRRCKDSEDIRDSLKVELTELRIENASLRGMLTSQQQRHEQELASIRRQHASELLQVRSQHKAHTAEQRRHFEHELSKLESRIREVVQKKNNQISAMQAQIRENAVLGEITGIMQDVSAQQ
ncbi:MAG: hypothetical protein MHM6MM_006866 [Cercozoa sp. M6MM]